MPKAEGDAQIWQPLCHKWDGATSTYTVMDGSSNKQQSKCPPSRSQSDWHKTYPWSAVTRPAGPPTRDRTLTAASRTTSESRSGENDNQQWTTPSSIFLRGREMSRTQTTTQRREILRAALGAVRPPKELAHKQKGECVRIRTRRQHPD